ncbi:glycosyltransferase family 4 protein [Acidobacteria bacterium AH-259-L09]|nr:glycosyltransferase family 4 protein [Acidobacteria bacterium AH-259-L09]
MRHSIFLSQQYLNKAKPDLLLTMLYFPLNRVNVPIVFEWDFFPYGPAYIQEEMRRRLYIPNWMIERSSHVIVRHELSLNTFKVLFPEFSDKGVVIPPYLPDLETLPEERVYEKFREFRHPKVRLLFVGNLARCKGLTELVEAYGMLKEMHREIELTVVSRFQDGIVELPPDVRTFSNLSQTEVYKLMGESHIFALPSKQEATGNVLWEALANGCAILSPALSPQKELFGQFGLTADPTSSEDLAEALEQMINDRDFCLACALKARSTFLENYHRSIVERKYYEVFKKAVFG